LQSARWGDGYGRTVNSEADIREAGAGPDDEIVFEGPVAKVADLVDAWIKTGAACPN